MKFIDLFSGIGGFRTGLEMNGHECVAFCEIDKYARQSYKAIYDTTNEEELHDITQVTDEQWRKYRGSVDIITGGFPCQAFSIAGNRRGFDDTRGTLFFEIARAIKEIQPSYALLENVKGLFSHDKGRTFGTIIQALDELGYVVEWGLFNSKFWGVPQNRERVFILVTRKDVFKEPKLFDLLKQQTEVDTRLVEILEDEVDEKYYLSEEKTKKLLLHLSPTMNCNFYAKDNIVVSEEVFYDDPFEYDYEYVEPEFRQIGEYYLLVNQDGSQAEVLIKLKEGVYETVRVIHDSDEIIRLELITAKDGMGRMGEQAIETFITNSCEPGDTINAYNRTVDKSGISPTLTTRPEGFKTAILPIVEDTQDLVQGVVVRTTEDGFHLARTDKKKSSVQGTHVTYPEGNSHCLSTAHKPMTLDGLRIRKLTPLECWRLQGFTDEQFYKAKNAGVSNSQLYKQAGNSVTVNVIDAIVKLL